jgi:hypothetical protein
MIPPELVSYLAAAGLLSKPCGCLILQATNRSSSHSVVELKLRNGEHWIVKRARERRESPGAPTLGAEFAVYQLAISNPALAHLLPECLHADEATQTLVLRSAGHRYQPDPASAAAFGADLAAFHRASESTTPLPFRRPWILDVLEPHGFQNSVTPALLNPHADVASRLRMLGEALEISCLVHNDVKFDNCVQQDHVRLIDWEIAGVGDPAWDVAGIVQDHLRVALQGGGGRETLAGFLNAYLRRYTPADARAFRMRISGFTAARLLQSAHELALAAGPSPAARLLADHAVSLLLAPESLFAVYRSAA